jgi:hypothetical protein
MIIECCRMGVNFQSDTVDSGSECVSEGKITNTLPSKSSLSGLCPAVKCIFLRAGSIMDLGNNPRRQQILRRVGGELCLRSIVTTCIFNAGWLLDH